MVDDRVRSADPYQTQSNVAQLRSSVAAAPLSSGAVKNGSSKYASRIFGVSPIGGGGVCVLEEEEEVRVGGGRMRRVGKSDTRHHSLPHDTTAVCHVSSTSSILIANVCFFWFRESGKQLAYAIYLTDNSLEQIVERGLVRLQFLVVLQGRWFPRRRKGEHKVRVRRR